MHARKIGSLAGHVLVLFVTIVGFAAASPRSPSQPKLLDVPAAFTLAEPTFAADYLAAYSRGDEVTADRVASPLYRLEWSRRRLSPADREALHPASQQSDHPAPWIRFTYVGGASDQNGFGHLLYVAHPIEWNHPSTPSAWRLDTDPSGRVIWAEMVFLFSSEVTTAKPTGRENAPSRLPTPDALGATGSRPIAGLQSLDSREGYYVAVMRPDGAEVSSAADAGAIAFYAIDADGRMRPGAWTYGQASSGPSEYGKTPNPPMVTLDPDVARLEQSYLQALW